MTNRPPFPVRSSPAADIPITILVLGLVLGLSSCVAFAEPLADGDLHTLTGQYAVDTTALYLRSGVVQTDDALKDPGELLAMGGEAGAEHFVIQLDGPMTPARRARLAAAGIQLGDYLPLNAYIATLDQVDRSAVRELTFVRWARRYEKRWKLSSSIGQRTVPFQTAERRAIAARGELLVDVILFRDAGLAAALQAVRRIPGAIVYDHGRVGQQAVIVVLLKPADLETIADIHSVQFIEECPEATPRNYTLRSIVQSGTIDLRPLYDNGLHGEGQVIGIIDTKVDIDHCSFVDDPNIPGPDHRKVLAYNSTLGSEYHGTHVACTAVGDGGEDNNKQGVAYLAKMVFGGTIPGSSGTALMDRLQFSHDNGARIHSNSWGNDTSTEYNNYCWQIDTFSRDNEEDMITFGTTNLSTLRTPENAKSVLAVGATQDNEGINNHCYGGVGPTADGRRKPEVYAPGCGIQSAQWNTACNAYPLSGTSMACPAVAGAAALVRQYFIDGYYPTGLAGQNEPITPSGAFLRATIINASVDMTGVSGYPSDLEGWGRLVADNALFFPGDTRTLLVREVRNASADALNTGEQWTYSFAVAGSSEQLRVTMAFTDVPATVGAAYAPVNDLDLEVTSLNDELYLGNVFESGSSVPGGSPDPLNCVEQVHVNSPPAGVWTVAVMGTAVNQETQGFALVITGEVSEACPGDLNGDGARNLTDFTVFAVAYNSHLGDPNYNPDADMDGDGFVNLTDFTAFASVYLVPCP